MRAAIAECSDSTFRNLVLKRPLAMSSDGLPIGVQIAAGLGREDLLIRLALQLEEAMPWAGRRPPVHASPAGA